MGCSVPLSSSGLCQPKPRVSPRNVAFYHSLTLVRKVYTLRRLQPAEWRELVPQLLARARAALQDLASPGLAR